MPQARKGVEALVSNEEKKLKQPEILKTPPTLDEVPEVDRKRIERRNIRKDELKSKLPVVRDRYRLAYGGELTRELLDEYAEECRKKEIFDFLQAKLGRLFKTDRELLAEILDE